MTTATRAPRDGEPRTTIVEPPDSIATAIESKVCHNCGAALDGPFCAACGQQDRPLDPTLRELAGEVAHELSSMDGRIFRSVRRLFLSPGFLTREYLEGRRASWVSPVRLYLLLSVVFFGMASLTGRSPIEFNLTFSVGPDEDPAETLRMLQTLGFSSEAEVERWVNDALSRWIPRAMFVLVPLFAWLVSRVRRRAGRKYPQHLIFALHVHAAFFGFQALALAGVYLAGTVVAAVLGGASALYVVTYIALALRRVYGGTKRQAFAHTATVVLSYWAATILISIAIIGPLLLWRAGVTRSG